MALSSDMKGSQLKHQRTSLKRGSNTCVDNGTLSKGHTLGTNPLHIRLT